MTLEIQIKYPKLDVAYTLNVKLLSIVCVCTKGLSYARDFVRAW